MDSNYKHTLNLPQTSFPMRANLPQTEPERIALWAKMDLYHKWQTRKAPRGEFVFADGPPYANGHLHLGHVLNKVLKDIVVKYKNMAGFRTAFIPGWDCHGLPIELKVTKKLGDKKKSMTPSEIRALCREEAKTWVDIQREEFIRLGIFADWEDPYLTMQASYEAEEIRVFAKIFENGYIYRGEKPVYWCPALQTALASAEVEYHQHKSPSIYIKFYLDSSSPVFGKLDKPAALVIWTTTPWTLPANYAVAVNPKFEYGLFTSGDEYLIFAADLKESIERELGTKLELLKTVPGTALEKQTTQHPFLNRKSLVILGDHVTLEASGIVHTAPGHGLDDYFVGLKYGLPVHSVVDEAGRFASDVPEFAGLKIWDANPKIVDRLRASGHLLAFKEITHSYPYNPRSKTPLIFRATPQWFIRMDGDDKSLRAEALKFVEKQIQFVPSWGHQRLFAMINNSPDWCLSRQRYWGVPIPVFYCASCGEPLAKASLMRKVADAMESSGRGIDAYFETQDKDFLAGETCRKCGAHEFKTGTDILDVWFDSGVYHTAVQKKRGLKFPADVYLEGSDQHRGWFQTSLLSSVATSGEAPFEALITHGFVKDLDGAKMSKSQGNAIEPKSLIAKNGAEILRLWVAYEDYGQDVTYGEEMFSRITDTYRRLRNTIRFMLGNLGDFDPARDQVAFEQMIPLDRWALGKLNLLIERSVAAYDAYEFYKVYHGLNTYFTVDLSATYLDILKDRLYTWKKTGHPRRSAQTAIYHILKTITPMMAPILSFLAEETYENLPGSKEESVFLDRFPEPIAKWHDENLLKEFEALLDVRSKASLQLEELRREKIIGSSLDARLDITAEGDIYATLIKHAPYLKEFFIVSEVDLHQGAFQIKTEKASGTKCVRCWNYDEETGKNKEFPDVCRKCVEALS